MDFSFEFNAFISKTYNGEKVRQPGTIISKDEFNLKSSNTLKVQNEFIRLVLSQSFKIGNISPLIERIFATFLSINGPILNINYLSDHYTLIELAKSNLPSNFKTFFPNQSATLLIDIGEFKHFDQANFRQISLIYRLGFIYGICRFIDLSIKESLAITLSILDNSSSPGLQNFINSCQNLDHDNSLYHCLSMTDNFDLENLINHKQVVLLAKQMNVSLPYSRDMFRKASSLMDIKLRREECLKIISNFKKSIESNNINSVLNKLKAESRYTDHKLRLVVGRESRAFGNQAYLFANSKLIYSSEKLKEKIDFIESLLNINELAGLNLENYVLEFKPSVSRLKSLISAKHFPFTQIASGITNLRECLDIFERRVKDKMHCKYKHLVEKSTSCSIELKKLNLDKEDEKSFDFMELDNFSAKITHEINKLEKLAHELNSSSTKSKRAAFSVLLQRPSYTGSDRFKLNELETKPEQEESLQKLVILGGDHLYMSPCYDWISEATDLIEAVPLFIYERIVLVDNKPETVFEVDQEGLELTIRQIADYWAENIEKTMDSEHVSLARSILVKLEPQLSKIFDEIKMEVNDEQIAELVTLDYLVLNKIESKETIENKIAKLALLLEMIYNKNIQQCEQIVEDFWSKHKFILRKESLEIYLHQNGLINSKLIEESTNLEIQDKFRHACFEKQRDLPAFHLLTTEAPGLIEGFITIVLEEEMAMRNLIKHHKLQHKCDQIDLQIKKNLFILSERVIKEFDYEPKVNHHVTLGNSYQSSVLKVLAENLPVQDQVSVLAILAEIYNLQNSLQTNFVSMDLDNNLIDAIEDYWLGEMCLDLDLVKSQAIDLVYERNRNEPDFCGVQHLQNDRVYSKELNAEIKWLIRGKCFKFVVEKYPSLCLRERRTNFVREHTALLKTTCRRLVISSNGLSSELNSPLFNFTNGFSDGMQSKGLKKRYHSIYAPSRVNLGKDERKSVEIWSQFLGVTDPLAAKHALDCYELINYCPVVRNIREAENLKVSENQWTALVRSCRNVQAFFVERLGIGDIEDLSYQFNQRGGLFFGSLKEAEGYNSGPTAGYCIPKDLLFKLFVGALQDTRKLGQLGIPKVLHGNLIQLMVEIYNAKSGFDSIQEWELWASQHLLNENYLSKMFDQCSFKIKDYLCNILKCSQTKIVFNLSKLIQIIGDTGIPNPMLSGERDLHSVLWSNWSDHKITLGGEQVNRSTVFTMTRDILQSARKSRELNANVAVVSEESLRIQMFGVYKGDDDEPPPPDVRYSWTMRAFQIMSGHYDKVADSLDIDGQIIARLSWVGFRPNSSDPRDVEAVNYLMKKFNYNHLSDDLVERFKKAFPCHSTVGDITITVVPGVDSEDLLGFSAETMTLLGDEADRARNILENLGKMSLDQIKANCILRRKFPEEWTPLNKLAVKEIEKIKDLIGGSIHPLVLRLRGPGTDFLNDLQGQDAVVFSITHPQMLTLNPAHLRDLMLLGRPNSALCALDFVSQGRHRCWYERDVMLWYAAARSLQLNGKLQLDWSKRNNRQSVYKAFGTGYDQYLPLLGTDLRTEVIRQENRAIEIWNAALKVVESCQDQKLAIDTYKSILKKHLSNLSCEILNLQQLAQRLLMAKRFKPRDKIILQSVEELVTSSQMERIFTRLHWLSIGGIFLINGSTRQNQCETLDIIRKCFQIINPQLEENLEEEKIISNLIVPQLEADRISLSEKKREMFSVKASEECQVRAIARRAQLSLENRQQNALKQRLDGFNQMSENLNAEQMFNNARDLMLNLSNTPANGAFDQDFVNKSFGQISRLAIEYTKVIIKKLTPSLISENMLDDLNELFTNGQLNLSVFDRFCGTYENHGHISKLFELTENKQKIFNCCELLYYLIALEKTNEYLSLKMCQFKSEIWRNLAQFFSKTIDDHFYEYNPWFLDQKRGSSFVQYYDYLGVLKQECSEQLYEISWNTHKILYQYLLNLILNHSDLRAQVPCESDRNFLIGLVKDNFVVIPAIGCNGTIGHYESLWRAYNQLRDITFMRNDGFEFPVIFTEFDEQFLNVNEKINFAILSPIGRTHYSRAIMQSAELNGNIFITRTGFVSDSFLFISDGHFYMTKQQYAQCLSHHGFGEKDIEACLKRDESCGRFSIKGIRCAAIFKQPILIGSCIAHHHHPLEIQLSKAGYPTTDKSPFLFDLTYNKSLYPLIYSRHGLLPPQIDWFHSETLNEHENLVIEKISARLRPFVATYPIIICKGSAESGARNLCRFDVLNEAVLSQAARFVYEVSKSQNVTIQKAILSTPLTWMSKYAIQKFIDRQINEYGVCVNVDKYPKDFIYGTLRVILSSSVPDLDDLYNWNNWQTSHLLSLSSLQTATNVGRQGTLELLSPEMIHSKYRNTFLNDLIQTSQKVMSITAKFAPTYWNEDIHLQADEIKAFKNRRSDVPEKDACDCPTWWPRYLMLDLIPEAIFVDNEGKEISNCQIIDIQVNLINDEDCEFIVMDSIGQKQQAKISKFKFWLLEPNVGIGLWPNYWKREEIRCIEFGNTDFINIGISDRIVLGNFLKAGEHFLSKKTKIYSNKSFIIRKKENVIDPPSELALCLYDSLFTVWQIYGIITIEQNQTSLWIKEALKLAFKNLAFNQNQLSNLLDCVSQNDVDFCKKKSQLEKNKIIPVIKIHSADVTKWLSDSVYKNRLIDLVTDSILSEPLVPQLQIAPCKQNFNLASRTFAVISDKLNLITHQIYPFIAGKGDHSINVVGLHPSWFLPGTNLVKRAIIFDFYSNLFVESDLNSFLVINHCFLVELNQTNEMENHSKLSLLYQSVGIDVINPFEQSQTRADDKLWIRRMEEKNFNIPKFILLNESTQDKVENFVADCQNGVVLQPSSNSTESNQVHYFDQFQVKEILQQSEQIKNPILSEFRGNVLYKQKHHCVFRFNVVCDHITIASYTSKSDSKIIGLRGTTGLVLDGYCERLEQVVNNLYEKSGKKITINSAQWNYLLGIAHSIGKKINLPIIGIDMIIESNDGMLTAYVLEVNARPGTLIFGEQLIFGDNKITSVMCPSVDENFCTQLACRTKSGKSFPQTLLDWKIFVSEKNNFISNLLEQRYSCEFFEERLNFIKKTIDDVIFNNFDLDREIKFLLVNGRHRYFGSHTDFLGLGGPTINATSQNEIMSICQTTKDNFIHITNSDLVYQSSIFQLNEIDFKNVKMEEKIWDPSDWISFLKACLAYMVINFQGVKDKIAGFRIHFSSCGLLKLNSGIGSSSSSALTSALVLSLNQLFDLNLSTIQLCQTDYAEFFLGKTAGCADKTSILNSVEKKMLFVSSMPEKILNKLCLPEKIAVLIVDSKIPRLNSPQSRDYLKKLSFSDDKIAAVNNWASGIMRKFGSFVFTYSLNLIKKSFHKMEKIKSIGIDDLSVKSLIDREDFLLRDLCAGGRLETFYKNKFKRYNLIFRLLKLLPQKVNVVIGTNEEVIYPRKSALFGLSEVERCHEYVQIMTNFDAKNVSYLFDLIKFSHNGDRACVDFRNDFGPTVWQSNKNNHITDELLDEWIVNDNELLCDKSGGFERSLPIFDEWADQLETTFGHKATLRVSAAGLGGNICVHTVNSIANDVMNWFEEKSLSVTVIKPGPSFKLF